MRLCGSRCTVGRTLRFLAIYREIAASRDLTVEAGGGTLYDSRSTRDDSEQRGSVGRRGRVRSLGTGAVQPRHAAGSDDRVHDPPPRVHRLDEDRRRASVPAGCGHTPGQTASAGGRGSLNSQLVDPGAQGGRIQAQEGGGAVRSADPPPRFFEYPNDMRAFHLVEPSPPARGDSDLRREQPVGQMECGSGRHDYRSLDHALQFADVAGPRIPL